MYVTGSSTCFSMKLIRVYDEKIRYSRGSSRKNVGNFNTKNMKFGIVGNDNLGA